MNETQQLQFQLDLRTGFQTAIHGNASSENIRSACSAINARRTRGIMEAAKHSPSSQSVQADVWAAAFTQQAQHWEVPLIDLSRLGISHNQDGFIHSEFLEALPSGAEASPYKDTENQVVYKLFDLKPNGSVGKKLVYANNYEIGFEIEQTDAIWLDTLEKLSVLNDAGGLITEIVGLASTGEYLIAKQPLAYPMHDFHEDRRRAEELLKSIVPIGEGLRQHMIVTFIHDTPWLVGDLHERNIMRDSNNQPVIIDALIGSITPLALKQLPWLRRACDQAEQFRLTNIKPTDDPFSDIPDDEL